MKKIRLSGHANDRLCIVRKVCFGTWAIIALFLVLTGVLIALTVGISLQTIIIWAVIVLAGLTAFCLPFILPTYHRMRNSILADNEADFRQSHRLKRILRDLMARDSASFPVLEQTVEGIWRPFRVEYVMSQSVRGDFRGMIELQGFGLIAFTGSGSVVGETTGYAVPNLLDMSSLLFLKSPENKTLRVLLPSPRASMELLASSIEKWTNAMPATFASGAVRSLFATNSDLLDSLSHSKFVDRLTASIEDAVEKRPLVGVKGHEIQDGVVLATALTVNGESKTFLPSGFFDALYKIVEPLLSTAEKPEMLTVVH